MSSKRSRKVAAVTMALVFGGFPGCAIMPQVYDGKVDMQEAFKQPVPKAKTMKYTSYSGKVPFHKQG
jgi:hypothetical protein